jgi:long-chain acyl-CoA synthetase
VYPEDIENAVRVAGIRDSVAVETRPGRIEVVVLAPGTHATPGDPKAASAIEKATPDDLRRQIEAAVKAANASLGPNQRIAGWKLWPEPDFPRTHTFKVKRDRVRTWATVDTPLPPDEDGGAAGSQG